MKKPFAFMLPMFLFLVACSEDNMNNVAIVGKSVLSCSSQPLEIRTEMEDCQPSTFFPVCGTYEIEDVNYMPLDEWDWLPMACQEIGDDLVFASETGQTTTLNIADKDHFIRQERLSLSCELSMEHVNYACQKNEVYVIKLIGSIFGTDEIELEVARRIVEIVDEQLSDPVSQFIIIQQPDHTNIPTFYHRFLTSDRDYDTRSRTFHDSIELNNEEYTEVVELKLRSTYWGDPFGRIYLKKRNWYPWV